MSRCGSCDLYWPEGKNNLGITCPGDQDVETCADNLQDLVHRLRMSMEPPKEGPIRGQINMFSKKYLCKWI